MNPLHKYILEHLPLLLNRDYLIDIFTESEKLEVVETLDNVFEVPAEFEGHIYPGKLCTNKGILYSILALDDRVKDKPTRITIQRIEGDPSKRLVTPQDPITIIANQIANYQGNTPLETTIGRLFLNYTVLVDPFQDAIPYLNTIWKVSAIEDQIVALLLDNKITPQQVKQYIKNVYWVGQFTELSVPVFSEKALTTSPEVLKRKKELFEEHKEAIANHDPVVFAKIENELIELDKEWLKGDPSMGFFGLNPASSFGNHRKRMFITVGVAEAFGHPGHYDITPNSLTEGWTQNSFTNIANEIRAGSYSRGIETAKGGEESNFIMRVFQNTKISEDDCGTTKYTIVSLTKDDASTYLYRWIYENGELVSITPENISKFIDKTVSMRSPQYCKSNPGYCFKCAGDLFKKLDQQSISLVAITLSSTFTNLALKKFHLIGVDTINIMSLNEYCI
jgi:hypothetical protein